MPFEDERESAQGFSHLGDRVGIATPPNTEVCTIRVERRQSRAPIDASVVQAVQFPLEVAAPLFVESPTLETLFGPLDVPEGRHDVVVEFRARKRPKASGNLRAWDVILAFSPPTKQRARMLRSLYAPA